MINVQDCINNALAHAAGKTEDRGPAPELAKPKAKSQPLKKSDPWQGDEDDERGMIVTVPNRGKEIEYTRKNYNDGCRNY